MLGVLTAVDQQGQSQVLKAFSGQITESWHIPERFIAQQQQLLKSRRKSISHHLLHCIQQSYQTCSVSGERLSLLDVYLSYLEQHDPGLPVTKIRGFIGMPAGVGDCCAPKLLHAAAAAKLVPTGLVEVWYGSPPGTATPAKKGRAAAAADPGNSGSRRHHDMYGMCDKCKAILGTMLCGLQGQVDMQGHIA
eukprot:gene6613-6841_t